MKFKIPERMSVACQSCGNGFSFTVEHQDYIDFLRGKKVQEVFPYLDANIRELLISRLCGKCYDDLCGDDL